MDPYSFLKLSLLTAGQLKDPSLFKQQSYVDGEWVDARSGKTFEVKGIQVTWPRMGKLCPDGKDRQTQPPDD